jgi:hypothetical protein
VWSSAEPDGGAGHGVVRAHCRVHSAWHIALAVFFPMAADASREGLGLRPALHLLPYHLVRNPPVEITDTEGLFGFKINCINED